MNKPLRKYFVTGLLIHAHHGVMDHEEKVGQRFVIDLELALDLGPERPRWTLSRRVLASPHQDRILEHLEVARRFFPELEGMTIRVGLALKRGVLGWGSFDPERPGVWVRPRRLDYFTIAHELTQGPACSSARAASSAGPRRRTGCRPPRRPTCSSW